MKWPNEKNLQVGTKNIMKHNMDQPIPIPPVSVGYLDAADMKNSPQDIQTMNQSFSGYT